MALIFSVVIILHYFCVPLFSQDVPVAELTLQNVLNELNSNNESEFVYSIPIATSVHISFKNESASLYVEQIELRLRECKKEEYLHCSERYIICAVVDKGNASEVISCSPKERFHHILNDLGYKEENAAQLSMVLKDAIERSINNGSERSIVDIMSAKREDSPDVTELYATVKVINADEGDALQFEVCEVEIISTRESDAVAKDINCFPISEAQTQHAVSEDEMQQIAQQVVKHLNDLSQSKFAYHLHEIIRAEKTVTPGSQGSSVNLQVKVVPSLCLKLPSFPINKSCPENKELSNMVCNVTQWSRPWKGDVVYSSPECRIDVEKSAALQSFEVGSPAHDHKVVDDSEIEKYLESIIEVDVPEPKEGSVGKSSDSETEESGSTASAVASNTEELKPVVEELITAKKAFCLGCPVDLNLNNPDLAQFVDLALSSIDTGTTNVYKHGLVSLRKAQRQVVNGIMYMLLLDVGETECLKESGTDRNLCSIDLKRDPSTCYIEIFEKPGLRKERKIVYNNCTDTVNNYPSNEIGVDAPAISISKKENTLTSYSENDRTQFGSLDDLTTVPADVPYGYASGYSGDYMEDSESIPFLRWVLGDYLSDTGDYYYVKRNARMKREGTAGFIGGLKDIGPGEEHLVNELAATAVETLDDIDEDNLKRVVVKVVDAKKQIMDGVMYHLRLVVGTSSCEENKAPNSDCLKEFVTPLSLCIVHLHRSFVNNSPRVQVVKSECSPKGEDQSADTFHPRTMEGDSSSGTDLDGYNPQIINVAEFALSEINKRLNSFHTLLNINNVHTEVQDDVNTYLTLKVAPCLNDNEAGTNCRPQTSEIKLCKAEVTGKVLQRTMKLLNFSCSTPLVKDKQQIHRRLGAPSPVDTNEPYIQEVADASLAELNRRSNSLYKHELIKILSAEVQVVAGRLIHLRMEIGHTTCGKEIENDSGDCSLQKDLGSEICDLRIWDRPWLKDRHIDKISCSPASIQRRKRSEESDLQPNRRLVGAPGNIDVDDHTVKNASAFAIAELDKQSNSQFKRKTVKVLDAKVQVVAGVLYHLTIESGETTCLKEAAQNAEECDLNKDSENHICKVKVLVQAWVDYWELTSSQCSVKSQNRRRRAIMQMDMPNSLIRGGSVKADVGDAAIREIASFALHEIDRASNSAMKKKIINILKAKTQVVEGKLYRLDLEIADTDCLKRNSFDGDCNVPEKVETQLCHVEVWERPWLKSRKVTKLSCSSKAWGQLQSNGQLQGRKNVLFGFFTEFMSKYNKTYSSDEEMQRRFHIFKANMMKIEHLQNTEQGTAKYGVTQFADLSETEFKQKYLGLNLALKRENEVPVANAKIPDVELPVEFDWRHYNVVTPVKNQGMCGSCWAFSVTGNVEGQWAIHKGELVSLSEQELVDCDTLDEGCQGGLPDNAYRAIEKLGGLETEKDYPYEGDDEKCHFNKSEVRVTIQGAVNISSNETQMAQWLVKNGPISIGINANAMQFYMGGVSHPWKFLCDPNDLDHGVLIVGFGVHKYPLFEKILPFWIIKNSWGETWGEQGYYRVYRGDGTCGVNMMASSALVA